MCQNGTLEASGDGTGALLSPSVPPPYPPRTPSLFVSGPKVCHFGTVRGGQATWKPVEFAGFHNKRFRLTTKRMSGLPAAPVL
jgi:hypothetical protein